MITTRQRKRETSFFGAARARANGKATMILVIATITATAGKRDELIEVAKKCVVETRKEDGCRQYDLMASTENDVDIAFFERWDSREALDQHMRTPHMAAFVKEKAEKNLQVGDLGVAIYDIA